MIANLDAMAAKYPDLITIKAPIDGIMTHENRPIYWIKISDNPNVDEVEPEVLYTALHHAREPGGLSSLIYFMWHTLENYDKDPKIKAMVDEGELYFIPCLNPDGYIFNINNYNNGEDFFWRKNRKDNGDGTFGVDLNRNYGYEFGFNNIGSSNMTDNATYRGPAAFSEPETQAAKIFCEAHEFEIALNYHTFGNLLIYPWGYDNIGIAEDVFVTLAQEMVAENNFFAGTGIETVNYEANGNSDNYLVGTGLETVGYFVNGDSDDWMYGENVTKPAIYAMTPELGLGGFYPAETEVLGIIQSSLAQNIATGLLPHSYVSIKEKNDPLISSVNTQDFKFLIKNIGLSPGDFTISLTAVSDNITTTGSSKTISLASQEEQEDFIDFDLADDIMAGEEVVFALSVDQGSYVFSDTITKLFGVRDIAFMDQGDNLDNWEMGNWATTTEDFVSASSSITDSPNDNYAENTISTITSKLISLVDAQSVYLSFWAKWNIEVNYDYVQINISKDGGITYEPQCGLYTRAGSNDQRPGEPLYDGLQSTWVKEEIDLSVYEGQDIILQFMLVSDEAQERDGFYFDDLEITKLLDNSVSTTQIKLEDLKIKTYPNPADQEMVLELSRAIPESTLYIYNAQGTAFYQKAFSNESRFKISVEEWAGGIYFYELINTENGSKNSGKIMIK